MRTWWHLRAGWRLRADLASMARFDRWRRALR